MWVEEFGEVLDMFKGSWPLTWLFLVPVLIMISPVQAAHEFSAYRMQQFDLHGTQFGCRNALVNMEARPINTPVLTRRCIITRLADLTAIGYREMMEQSAGGLLILLPKDLSTLPQDVLKHWLELEPQMMEQETTMPVYFAHEDEKLLAILEEINKAGSSDQAGTAAEALLSAVYGNGFQMVVSGPQAKAIKDAPIISLQGKLTGKGVEDQLPTIAIVAHYDTFGIAPHLSFGADSNGSGVAALLELSRLLSKLYTNSRTHAKFNFLFLLSGGGKYGYQGTKRWIEDSLESTESTLLSDVSFVLCLDSIGASNDLFLHVSKPPKEGSTSHQIYKELETVSNSLYPSVNFSMIHKKINLADDLLAWEHERFSMRRLPAASLSHLKIHRDEYRTSILDDRSRVDVDVLARNVKIIAEALGRHIYGISKNSLDKQPEIFVDGMGVNRDFLASWVNYLSTNPRPAQLMVSKDQPVLSTLEQTLSKHLMKEVKMLSIKADKREPEFVFYDGLKFTMYAYNVKPAVFDLFLAAGIAGYLGLVYLAVMHFSTFMAFVKRFSVPSTKHKES
ncbi:nicalin-like isoform X2 [Acanthaster planci]|uniref:Nicalin n=1 Tax=Acanthaster planci TaxID=133434 RepID=A0A8B7ZIC5_ACAPL|nr:nicalin-like isoform X2 [Acanthaster planci]